MGLASGVATVTAVHLNPCLSRLGAQRLEMRRIPSTPVAHPIKSRLPELAQNGKMSS